MKNGDTVATSPKFTMTVDLSVLESLGINLYSNAAAVLSELVANAYDADATEVDIKWKEAGQRIEVSDNGSGMSAAELNDRFLKVGYKKRSNEGLISPKFSRPFMGRKGIGKLSVFSIASVVTVFSNNGSESNGLRISVKKLESAIRAGRDYHPDEIAVPAKYQKPGTTLVLTNLRNKRADLTASALRKRIARRFDVLDQTPPKDGGFYISVNGARVTFEDRQELKKLEFIWEFGSGQLPASALPADITRFVLPNTEVKPGTGWRVRGWIGTARRPTELTEDREAGSLKNIIVLARKRPIQEGIIERLDFSQLFGNYVTGQIEADFLDMDGDFEDIATTDRQRMIEDDERVVALLGFLREAFLAAAEQWSESRPKKEAKSALTTYPKLAEWVDGLPPWQRSAAHRMLGMVASLEMEKSNETENRLALFRSGILAFERVGLREIASDLEGLSELTAEDLLPLLGAQDAYEEGLWTDILRSRVEAIDQFRGLAKADEKEKVLQLHLFDHLWLLDASWERATAGGRMEEDLRSIEPGLFAVDGKGKRVHGRMDIRYVTAAGSHVIVELKRYSRTVDVDELVEQGLKYVTALTSILSQQNRADEAVEVVFVLGDHPTTKNAGLLENSEYISNVFRAINGRYVLYDELIENAKRQYEDYLSASDRARELDQLLESLS